MPDEAADATAPVGVKTDDGLVDVDKLQQHVATSSFTTYANRRYAPAHLGHYYMPNDTPEIHRLNDQHLILTVLKDGKLHNAPLPRQSNDNNAPFRILDVGCGSGIWCVEMAERYPHADIVGMDVSAIQPENRPKNVEWIVHDMENEWPFPDEHFNFIHLSLVHGCVADWEEMMSRIVRHLTPGGYLEHQEFSLCRQYTVSPPPACTHYCPPTPLSDADLAALPTFFRWGRLMERAAHLRGRTIQLGPLLPSLQRTAGLQNVTETVYCLPCGTWPEDEKERWLGARWMLGAVQGMEGFTTVMFTKVLGWGLEETQEFLVRMRRDLRDDGLRKCMDVHVVFGRKEEGGGGEGEREPEEAWRGLWRSQSVRFAGGVVVAGVVTAWVGRWWMRRGGV